MKQTQVLIASLILLNGLAFAQGGGGRGKPPEMTAAQKACFTDNGQTAPGDGAPPTTRPSDDVREKIHACLEKNGFKGGPHGGGHRGPPPGDSGAEGSTGSTSSSSGSAE